ncbi:hypothetical protein [Pseudoalteromonas luteoviolacea]|nr:hypothetical protein [Pseudoalteromonas luteoviolacea]
MSASVAASSLLFAGYLGAISLPIMNILSLWGWLIPMLVIVSLIIGITLLSAWGVIRQADYNASLPIRCFQVFMVAGLPNTCSFSSKIRLFGDRD